MPQSRCTEGRFQTRFCKQRSPCKPLSRGMSVPPSQVPMDTVPQFSKCSRLVSMINGMLAAIMFVTGFAGCFPNSAMMVYDGMLCFDHLKQPRLQARCLMMLIGNPVMVLAARRY